MLTSALVVTLERCGAMLKNNILVLYVMAFWPFPTFSNFSRIVQRLDVIAEFPNKNVDECRRG